MRLDLRDLPGAADAARLRYVLTSAAPDGSSAMYVRHVDGVALFLSVDQAGACMLERRLGLVLARVGPFQMLHRNLREYEAALLGLQG